MKVLTENKIISKIIEITHLNSHTYKVKLERNGINFIPGQHMLIGFPNEKENREYSIYSPTDADYLEFLIKAVDDGDVSSRLKKIKEGDIIQIEGPYGFFILPEHSKDQKHIFLATGTGIAPFHSMILSEQSLNYELIHGIRHLIDIYDSNDYISGHKTFCISRENTDHFKGRITDYLLSHQFPRSAIYFLCGNSAMIEDVQNILEDRGINPQNIKTEIYF